MWVTWSAVIEMEVACSQYATLAQHAMGADKHFQQRKKIKSEMKFAFTITSFVSRAHRRWRIFIVPT